MTNNEYAEILDETNGIVLCYKDGDNIYPALVNKDTAQMLSLFIGNITVPKEEFNRFQKVKNKL